MQAPHGARQRVLIEALAESDPARLRPELLQVAAVAVRCVVSDLVDPGEIEAIVGVERHPTEHWARAVSAEERVFVLHSEGCRASTPDLRDCPFSLALDRGISTDLRTWLAWKARMDVPVEVMIHRGFLRPRSVRRLGRGG